jgi:hypothetical protein
MLRRGPVCAGYEQLIYKGGYVMKNTFGKTILLLIAAVLCAAVGCSKSGAEAKGDKGVDVDITNLILTVMTAQINNIMLNPEDFLGKVIKTTGMYSPMYYDVTDEYIHYAGYLDPTGCCFTGLEFKLDEELLYPADYPEENSVVTLVGTYNSAKEPDGTVYYYISVDELTS